MTSGNRLVAVVCVAAAVFITGACSFASDGGAEGSGNSTPTPSQSQPQSQSQSQSQTPSSRVEKLAAAAASPSHSPTPPETAEPTASSPSPVAATPNAGAASPVSESEILEILPQETYGFTYEGALRFAIFMVDLEYEMYRPPYDSTLYSALTSSDCESCADNLSDAADYEVVGQYTEKSPCREATALRGGVSEDTSTQWITYHLCDEGLQVDQKAENVTEITPYNQYCVESKLEWVELHWTLEEVTLLTAADCAHIVTPATPGTAEN